MDCPKCKAVLEGVMKLKKHERIPVQRRHQGIVITRVIGDTRKQTPKGMGVLPPDGMTVIDECKSCHWKSVRKYNRAKRKWVYQERLN